MRPEGRRPGQRQIGRDAASECRDRKRDHELVALTETAGPEAKPPRLYHRTPTASRPRLAFARLRGHWRNARTP